MITLENNQENIEFFKKELIQNLKPGHLLYNSYRTEFDGAFLMSDFDRWVLVLSNVFPSKHNSNYILKALQIKNLKVCDTFLLKAFTMYCIKWYNEKNELLYCYDEDTGKLKFKF